MKKTGLILMALCMCHTVFSQETETVKTELKNEIKLNLATSIASYPEISYERNLAGDLGLGLSVAASIGDEVFNTFQITPYFRFYFGNKPYKVFFIEANAALAGFKEYDYRKSGGYGYGYEYNYEYYSKTVVDFGLGFAIGYKFFNRKDFTGEIYCGIGRTFGDRVYPRIGINLGKQF